MESSRGRDAEDENTEGTPTFSVQPNPTHPAAAEQDAREHLRILDEVVENRDAHAPPAALLWLQILNGALAAVLVGVWPFTLADPVPVSMLLVIPQLATVGLVGGAWERFGVRRWQSKAQQLVTIVGFASFLAVMAYTVFFGVPPRWVAAGPAVMLFAGLAMRPALDLRKAYATKERARMLSVVLSPSARRTTVTIGAGLGLLVAVAPFSLIASLASSGILLLLVLGIVARASQWSLHWVGFEWGITQWSAFCVSVAALVAVAVATLQLGSLSPIVTVLSGCGIFAIMTASTVARPQPSER